MKKLLIILLIFLLPSVAFASIDGSFGLSFGPSVSYYTIEDSDIFSNELAIRVEASNKLTNNFKLQYALGFNYPSLCFINWDNIGLTNRLTDLTVEFGVGFILPANSRVEMALGSGLSFYMGARPIKGGERIYQYALNLDAFFSTLFEVNPVFGITMDLRVSAPLYIFSMGEGYQKHSSMTGVSSLISLGFVYLY